MRAFLEQRKSELVVRDLDMAAFVLVTAVEAVTHNVVLNHAERLSTEALETEIGDLVLRYLLGAAAP